MLLVWPVYNFSHGKGKSRNYSEIDYIHIHFRILIVNSKGSQPFPKKALVFRCLRYKSFENTVGKGENADNQHFLLSFSHSVFYLIKEINHHFSNIHLVVCKCFQFGHVQIPSFWERVKISYRDPKRICDL